MLILLPGMDGTGFLFEPFLKLLPEGYQVRVIRYPVDADLTYEQLALYVLEQLPVDQAITILAESFSGPIALRLSRQKQLKVETIVLVCSFAARPLGMFGETIGRMPLEMPWWNLKSSLVRTFLLGEGASEDLVRDTRDAISAVQPVVLSGRVYEALTASWDHPISPSARVLAIFARQDKLLGKNARKSLKKACPLLEEHWIDAPHMAMQAAPDKVLEVLQRAGIVPRRVVERRFDAAAGTR